MRVVRKKKRKSPILPPEVNTLGPPIEHEEAKRARQLAYADQLSLLGETWERKLRFVQKEFGISKEKAREICRDADAVFAVQTAEDAALRRAARTKRLQRNVNVMFAIAVDEKRPINERIRASRAHALNEKILAELEGTLDPVRVEVTMRENRELIVRAVESMTDAEWEEIQVQDGTRGKTSEAAP